MVIERQEKKIRIKGMRQIRKIRKRNWNDKQNR